MNLAKEKKKSLMKQNQSEKKYLSKFLDNYDSFYVESA